MRKADVQNVFAALEIGRQKLFVVLRIERLRLGNVPRAHQVIKFTEIRRLAEIVKIFLPVDIVGHGDIVEPELLGARVPQLAVGIKDHCTHGIFLVLSLIFVTFVVFILLPRAPFVNKI